jgi:transposase-like protein
MTLKALVEKGSDDDLLRDVANRMMDLEVENVTGAAHGERSPARINHRNGYRHRAWGTRAVADRCARFPKLGELMDEAEDDVLAHMGFPKDRWQQIHSTNPLERLNGEIKRCSADPDRVPGRGVRAPVMA